MSTKKAKEVYQVVSVASSDEVQDRKDRQKRYNAQHPELASCKLFISQYSSTECEELVFMHPKEFKEVFGEEDSKRSRKKHTIVKITNPESKICIYRLFRTSRDISGVEDFVGLTYTGKRLLTCSEEGLNDLQHVVVSEGTIIPFYWNHPNPATRISYKLGIWGILTSCVATIVSLIITLL